MIETGPRISRLGLGCSRVGSFNNPTPPEEVRKVLASALDLGVTVFDTSNIYGQGDSEREIGRALRRRRDEAFVMTKVGMRFSAKMQAIAFAKPLIRALAPPRVAKAQVTARRDDYLGADFSPAGFRASLEGSLKRLGMDHVDALFLHSPSAQDVLQPGVDEALGALRSMGLARRPGVSVDDIECLRAAMTLGALSIVQLPVQMLAAAEAEGLLQQLRTRGVVIILREVIAGQPSLMPSEAIAAACARTDIDCALVGISKMDHLVAATEAAKRAAGQ